MTVKVKLQEQQKPQPTWKNSGNNISLESVHGAEWLAEDAVKWNLTQ